MLGNAIVDSENKIISWTGQLAIVASFLANNFSLGVRIAVTALANLAISIGDKLIGAMTEFEAKASKAEASLRSFEFAINGFSRALGEDAVGSLSEWNKIIDQTEQNTNSSVGEIRKSIKLLVADTSGMGISFQQMQEVLSRTSDIAENNQLDLVQTTRNVIAALGGQGVALRNMGVDLTNAGLEHSHYVERLDQTLEGLEEAEKTQVRFNVLMEKSAPIIGIAKDATDTLQSANLKLDQSLLKIQQTLGQQSEATKAYTVGLTKLANIFLQLPSSIVSAVGAAQDFLGVSLKIIGTILKYAFVISTLSIAYGFLKIALIENATVHAFLSKSALKAASVLGVETVAVTGLSSSMGALSIVMKGALASAFTSLKVLMIDLALTIKTVTVAIVSNPLFWKALAIATAIVVVGKAVIDLTKDLKESISVLGEHGKAMDQGLKKVVSWVICSRV